MVVLEEAVVRGVTLGGAAEVLFSEASAAFVVSSLDIVLKKYKR